MLSHNPIKLGKAAFLFLLLTLPLFLLINPVSSANEDLTEVELTPIADAYVDSDEPDSNFGDSSYLYAKFWDYSGSTFDVRSNSYLKFDLSAVSADFNIVYAKLELYCWSAWSPPPIVSAHYCADDSWSETGITWSNAPSFSSTPTCDNSISGDDQWYTWDIVNDVKTALNDGILTVALNVQNTGDSLHSSFYSKESWDDNPKLVIGYATQTVCSASPSIVPLGDAVTVSGYIPLQQSDTVQLTYTRPDMSTVVKPVTTDSSGNFVDTYTPAVGGMWSVTAAWDGGGGYSSSSSTDTFMVTTNERDSWAIVVGVANYQYISDLDYSDNDAIDLANKLKEVWPEDHVRLLVDQNASKSDVESAITDWLAPKETAESVVLFFFSGHGCSGYDVSPYDEIDGEDEYICPYDSLTYSYSNDISDDVLDDWLSTLNSQRISVFIDSCYSGGFIDKETKKELPPSAGPADSFAKDLSKAGRVIITASAEAESSWESVALRHGVFAYYLLECFDDLEVLDDNGDNDISAEETFEYLAPLVRIYTDWDQHPQMYDGYEGELTLISTATINFDTTTSEASITVDGVSYTTSVSFVWAFYTEHTFSVPAQLVPEDGTKHSFVSWSDGSTLVSRTIIISEFVLTSYTANYQTQYYLSVDSDYGSPAGEGWYDSGSTASFSVESVVSISEGTQIAFTSWFGDSSSTSSSATLVMDEPKEVSAEWQTQYYLSVSVDPVGVVSLSGEGWYDAGSEALAENASSTCSGGEGARYIFETWKVDDLAEGGNPVSVLMDSPHSVMACYRTQYYLTVVSQHDPAEGEGWYDKDSEASFSVQSPQGFIIQNVFTRWSGDSTSTSQSATTLMDSPKTVTANWTKEYLQLYIIIVVVVAVSAAISIVAIRKLKAS